MVYSFTFRADFTDGTSLDQGTDVSERFPSKSRFTDLLAAQQEGKVLDTFHLLGHGIDLCLEMRTGEFFCNGAADMIKEHVLGWVEGNGDPLPSGLIPKLIYYRNHIPKAIAGPQPDVPVVLFCVGWEAGKVKNILGIRP